MMNKKAISNMFIITLIIGIISFLMITFYILNMKNEFIYQNAITNCQYTFTNINGETQYFENGKITPTLKELILGTCPYQTAELKREQEIKKAIKVVNECWIKTSYGKNIFGPIGDGKTFCLLCGVIRSKNKIDNFNTLFSKEIRKDKYEKLFEESNQAKNLNKLFLKDEKLIPKSIDPENEILVVYYTAVPKINSLLDSDLSFIDNNLGRMTYDEPLTEEIKKALIDFSKTMVNSGYSNSGYLLGKMVYVFSTQPEETISGITLIKHKRNNNEGNFDLSQEEMIMNCGGNLIIPNSIEDELVIK